ncbi:hypothetical protein EDC04DRAFT_174388 [Pisolithus marmoratus]|nr:hypothetical protein EDC04DRAFT_174388 [Pisolithus marmoratus]
MITSRALLVHLSSAPICMRASASPRVLRGTCQRTLRSVPGYVPSFSERHTPGYPVLCLRCHWSFLHQLHNRELSPKGLYGQ